MDSGCQWRSRAFEWVVGYWGDAGFRVVVGEGDSRAAARNDAASRAGSGMLVLADADTVVPAGQVRAAVDLAESAGTMVIAFSLHLKFHRDMTRRILDGPGVKVQDIPLQFGRTVKKCSSGCNVVPRGVLDRVGGFDTRFRGWGGEDRAFKYAVDTLVGQTGVIPGYSYHLWHPLDREAVRGIGPSREAVDLASRYKRAAGVVHAEGFLPRARDAILDLDGMMGILSEPGGPLGSTELEWSG